MCSVTDNNYLTLNKRSAGEKIAVNARIDAALIRKLDKLAQQDGTLHYQRSRSELIGFAVREYGDRHGRKAKGSQVIGLTVSCGLFLHPSSSCKGVRC